MMKIRKILFPTDFSEHADHAAAYVAEMARLFKAEVILLHVVPPLLYPMTYGYGMEVENLEKEIQETGERKLAEYAAELEGRGLSVRPEQSLGEPFLQIIESARRHQADLIVMASRGHGLVEHFLLGSTAEKVLRKAPCPVLSIRQPEA